MSEAAPPAAAPPSETARPFPALGRNVFFLVAGQAATIALSLALSAALGRSFGAADFGLLYLVTTMTTFAYGFIEWGQGLYVAREVARDPGRAGELLGSAVAFRVACAAAVGGPAVLLAWLLGYRGSTLSLYAILLAANLPLSIVQAHGVVFRGCERMELDALLAVATKALTLGATLAALALGGRVLAVILAQGVAAALAVAAAIAVARAVRLPRLRVVPGTLRELLAGGAPIVALYGAIVAQPYLDAIVLSKFAPPHVMGWHAAAKTFMGALVAPALILASAAYPRLSRAVRDPDAFRRELGTVMRPLLWVAAAVTSATYLFADVAVGAVYGDGFGPAATALELFAPALLLFFIDILLGHACVAAGKAKAFAVAKMISVIVSTALGVVLVPVLQQRAGNGVLGVVIAFAASELVMIVAATTLLPCGALSAGVVVDIGRAVVSAAGAPLLMAALPPMGAMLRGAVGGSAFFALSAAVGLVTAADVAQLRHIFRNRGADAAA